MIKTRRKSDTRISVRTETFRTQSSPSATVFPLDKVITARIKDVQFRITAVI